MHYELWHIPSGNLLNAYDTEAEALSSVLQVLQTEGRAEAEALTLAVEDRRGRTRHLAGGYELVERALARTPHDAPNTAIA